MPLDPQTNQEQKAAVQAQAAEPPPLNPDFPFTTVSFDPFFFGLDRDALPPVVKPGRG